MRTQSRSSHLRACAIRAGAALLAFAFCTSAFADPSKNVVTAKRTATTTVKRNVKCYTWVTGYGMPMPCEQMHGPVATTSRALITISNHGNNAD